LRASGLAVYLLNVFGDSWKVALPSASFQRVAGTGLNEVVTADISYTEITA
jgi:hypothetical protein